MGSLFILPWSVAPGGVSEPGFVPLPIFSRAFTFSRLLGALLAVPFLKVASGSFPSLAFGNPECFLVFFGLAESLFGLPAILFTWACLFGERVVVVFVTFRAPETFFIIFSSHI